MEEKLIILFVFWCFIVACMFYVIVKRKLKISKIGGRIGLEYSLIKKNMDTYKDCSKEGFIYELDDFLYKREIEGKALQKEHASIWEAISFWNSINKHHQKELVSSLRNTTASNTLVENFKKLKYKSGKINDIKSQNSFPSSENSNSAPGIGHDHKKCQVDIMKQCLLYSDKSENFLRWGFFANYIGAFKNEYPNDKIGIKSLKKEISKYTPLEDKFGSDPRPMETPYDSRFTNSTIKKHAREVHKFFRSHECELGLKGLYDELKFNDKLVKDNFIPKLFSDYTFLDQNQVKPDQDSVSAN